MGALKEDFILPLVISTAIYLISFSYRYFPNFISFFVVVVFRGNKNTSLFDHNLLAIEKHVGMFQLWLEVGKSMPIFRKKTS